MWPEQRTCSYANDGRVDPGRVGVDEDTLAQLDLRSVVHVYWSFNPWLIVKLCLIGSSIGQG